ncbi:LuxR C-terminal-related transcriptional regulator [Streptomyces sp. NPDC008125]|uniref:helix-turn-helix transcriptional regulator n=1 Tax=Streptomyces sp. NPDC008125 TaxID=3364811 RepID=UPI0036E62291
MILATDILPTTTGAADRAPATTGRPHRPVGERLRESVLRLVHNDEGGVRWVEGCAGSGKSHALARAAEEARLAGALVLYGKGVAGPGVPPLTPLLEALAHTHAAGNSGSDAPHPAIRRAEDCLRDFAGGQPVVFVLDDVEYCDGLTLLAVRTLTERLAGLPLLWLLAARTSHDVPAVTSLRHDLLTGGATTVELRPLLPGAVDALVGELLGPRAETAQPYLPLLGGLPGAVRHLCALLRAGSGPERDDDAAPDRVAGAVIARRLEQLTTSAKDLVLIASALDDGTGVGVRHLCGMLGRDEALLLPPLREVLATQLMRADRGHLSFSHPLVRETVRATLPTPVRHSVCRRSIGLRLAEGAPAASLAAGIAEVAETGDEQAMRILRAAALEVAPFAPAVAATHLRSAMHLSRAAPRRRLRLAAQLVPVLRETGETDEALALARDILQTPPDPVTHARVCLEAVRTGGPFPVPEAEAHVRRALHHPDVPQPVKDQLVTVTSLRGLLTGGSDGGLDATGPARRTSPGSTHPVSALTRRTLRSMNAGRRHRWEEALGHSEAVPPMIAELDPSYGPELPEAVLSMAWRATLLGLTGAGRAAAELVDGGLADSERRGRQARLSLWRTARARLLLDAGKLSDAARELMAAGTGPRSPGVLAAGETVRVCTRARVALHTGDSAVMDECADVADGYLTSNDPQLRRAGAWIRLLAADYRSETLAPHHLRAAAAHLRSGFVHASCIDAGDVVLLTEAALAAGQREVAVDAVDFSVERARLNPGLPLCAAAAAHARGVLTRGADLLVEAAELHGEARPLLRARALESAAECAAPDGARTAPSLAGEALRLYDDCAAAHDGRRVRARISELAARPLAAARTPAVADTPWRGLTRSELGVVRLVAHGATNREAAQRLFVSPHTVNTHLRHAYEKLGVRSRAQLARLYAREVDGGTSARPLPATDARPR